MRRAFSGMLRGETRPLKHICPPPTHSPHSDLSYPPFRVRCAESVHQHHSSLVWQLGDASGLLRLPSIPLPPADRVIGDTLLFSSPPLFSSVLHSPSSQTRTPRALLCGGGLHLSQTFLTPQVRYVFLSTTLCFLYRISFTNRSVYQGYRFGFSAQSGPATHFSLGGIPPASTGFS